MTQVYNAYKKNTLTIKIQNKVKGWISLKTTQKSSTNYKTKSNNTQKELYIITRWDLSQDCKVSLISENQFMQYIIEWDKHYMIISVNTKKRKIQHSFMI